MSYQQAMIRNMDKIPDRVPNFVVKSTKNIAITSCVILTPFALFDLYQGNIWLGLGILSLVGLYFYAAYRCHLNDYSIRLSLYGIAPLITCLSGFALYKLGIAASFWSFPALFVLYFVLPIRFAALINILFVVAVLPISYHVMALNEFSRFYMVLIGSSAFVYMCMKEIDSQHELLSRLSYTDTLTGLHNRSQLNDRLQQAINLKHRYHTAMTILMVDIDHFKKINDNFGHGVGDDVLKNMATLMQKTFRDPDIIFRVGGEEFLVLLSETDSKDSHVIAERFRQVIEQHTFVQDYKLTISIGVAELTDHAKPETWMAECDKMLYTAKHAGRNNVK